MNDNNYDYDENDYHDGDENIQYLRKIMLKILLNIDIPVYILLLDGNLFQSMRSNPHGKWFLLHCLQ